MVVLNELADNRGARKNRKRVGRGIGSGTGKTAGRGEKGQKSRSGVAINGFEGGQMPIFRRLPKRGFSNPSRKEFALVNIGALQGFVDAKKISVSKPINCELLLETGIINNPKDGIKLLAKGELTAKLTIELDAASEAAIKAVEKAGGKVTVIEKKRPANVRVKKESRNKAPKNDKEQDAEAA